jgi:hypothetical protein
MAISPAFTGLFFCFAAMVLLLFVSVSAPTWSDVYFLRVNAPATPSTQLRYGIFGYCVTGKGCSAATFGYPLSLAGLGNNQTFGTTGLHNLTKALIVHPIAGALALLAVIWGMLGVCAASRACTILMSITAFFALLGALVAFAIDLALWIIMRDDVQNAGYSATLGNAIWLTLGAFVALILGTCTAACGSCGRFATGRMGGEKY